MRVYLKVLNCRALSALYLDQKNPPAKTWRKLLSVRMQEKSSIHQGFCEHSLVDASVHV